MIKTQRFGYDKNMPEGVAEILTPNDTAMAESHINFEIAETQQVERSQADRFLETGRERYADARNKPNNMQIVADLIDYLGVETDDIFDKKDSNPRWKKDVKDLSDMKELVANSIVEGFDNHNNELVNLRKYLTEREEHAGDADQAMFEAFLAYLPRPAIEDAVAVPTENTAETQHTQPQLEDYAYAPVRVNQALRELVAA